ncbi:MAG: GNAT family N-acetyltransferase [Solobacterium sp.]|nr:GNAT family N-acetyltransferase [Solobacterium sp.]
MKKLFTEIPYIKGDRLVIGRVEEKDAEGLQELVDSAAVYRWLPTFLYEKKYRDVHYVIEHLYEECWQESIILAIRLEERFCGLIELYGYKEGIHKISVGYRLLERCWGQGIATEALGMMVDWLGRETDIGIITASTMVENAASAGVLRKNGFVQVVHAVGEDWGYSTPTLADKWIR